MEYRDQLTAFSFPESRGATRVFFQRFWLKEQRLNSFWRPVIDTVFRRLGRGYIDIDVDEDWVLIPMVGGSVFTQVEYSLLMAYAIEIGDVTYAVIEDYDVQDPPHNSGPPLRFEFPCTALWGEVNSGGYISVELFHMPHKDYFVVGNQGKWAKYVANDYELPLNLLFVRRGLQSEFMTAFDPFFRKDEEAIMRLLPAHLADRVIR